MQIETENEGDFYIIKILGEVDVSSSIILNDAIQEAISQEETKIVVDCQELTYIASAGLGVFTSIIQDFADKNIYLALFNMSEKIKNVFEIVGLHNLLNIVSDLEEARKMYNDSLL